MFSQQTFCWCLSQLQNGLIGLNMVEWYSIEWTIRTLNALKYIEIKNVPNLLWLRIRHQDQTSQLHCLTNCKLSLEDGSDTETLKPSDTFCEVSSDVKCCVLCAVSVGPLVVPFVVARSGQLKLKSGWGWWWVTISVVCSRRIRMPPKRAWKHRIWMEIMETY